MIIDRIEGDIAVVEVEKGQLRDVPLARIEGRARDGAVLIAQDGGYAVDEAATAQRLDAVNAKRRRVFRR